MPTLSCKNKSLWSSAEVKAEPAFIRRRELIASVISGQGELIHGGGESDVYRVGNFVVKRLHDGNCGPYGMTHGESLKTVASGINRAPGDSMNVRVNALECLEDRNDPFVVSAFVEGPNLGELYHYASFSPHDPTIKNEASPAICAFLASHPEFSCEDFTRQVDRLLNRMMSAEWGDINCTPLHSHFLVSDVTPPPCREDFQRVILILIDYR